MNFKTSIFLPALVLLSLLLDASAQTLQIKAAGGAKIEHSSWVMQARFLPDGQQIVAVDLDGFIRFYDPKTGSLLREIKPRDSQKLLCLEISPDGKRIVTGSNQGKTQFWNVATAQLEREIVADKSIVNAVAFSSDGKHLATGGSEGKIRIWSSESGTLEKELNPNAGDVVSLAFAPDGVHLVAGSLNRQLKSNGGEVGIWKWANGERVRSFPGAPGVRALSISPDGKLFAFASFNPTTQLFMMPTGGSQNFSVMTRGLGESDDPTKVAVHEFATGKLIRNIEAELGATTLAFAPDSSVLACGGDHGVILYDLVRQSLLERGRYDTNNRVDCVAYHQNQLIISTEKNRLAEFGEGGLEKIFSPAFHVITSMARDGMTSAMSVTETGKITGGSTIEILNVTARQSPEDTKLWDINRRVMAKEDMEKIRTDLEKLITEFPRFAEARRILAAFFEPQDTTRSRPLIESALKADPACIACHRSLGDILNNEGMLKESIASYRRVLELNSNYGLVRGRLAATLAQLALKTLNPDDEKSMKATVKLYEEALRLRPTEPQYYSNLSTVYFFGRDFETTIKLLEASIALRPNRARPYYNLGHAWREKGNKAKAIAAYKQYVALGEIGEDARIQKAVKLIEDLGR